MIECKDVTTRQLKRQREKRVRDEFNGFLSHGLNTDFR
jgi:hypothetical protein